MMDFILQSTSSLLVSIVLVICTIIFFKAYLTGPPGPWGLPILGYYPFIGSKFHLDLANLAKKYGEVFIFNCAGQEYIHLNSLKALKEAHVTQVDCFATRCHKHSVFEIIFGKGAGFVEGEKWRVLRKFLVQGMRQFGIGGSSGDFKGPVVDSVNETLEELKKKDGEVVDMVSLLTKMCTFSVRQIFFGHVVSEEQSARVVEAYERTAMGFGGKNMLLAGNFAKYFIFPWKKDLQLMNSSKKELDSMLHKIVNDHKPTLDFENPRDFIDLYLIEKKSREEKNDYQASFFTDEALVATLIQAFGDGAYGIGFFIAAFLRALSFLPDVQNKMHEEIVNVIGTERLPTWEDRTILTYTMAAIRELIRTSLINPAMPGLECTKNTTVFGVPVSKGQITVINIYSVHHDPSTFKDPFRFDPERFIFDTSLPTIGFGLGKRACAGEAMVMQETFVCIASICQYFSLSPSDDGISDHGTITSVEDAGNCKVKVSLRKQVDNIS